MTQFHVDLVIEGRLVRFGVWEIEEGTWRAAPMERWLDGSFRLSVAPAFCSGRTPDAALGAAVARLVALLLPTLLPERSADEVPSALPGVVAPTQNDPQPAVVAPVPTQDAPASLSREERAAGLASTITAAFERLAQQLQEGHTQEYLETLAFYSRFWTYSVNNMLLIKAQLPYASRVAGMRTWNELGYTIKKGEKAAWIWCPIIKKEIDPATGDRVETVVGFRPGPVFDVWQLNEIGEKPLPSPFAPLPDDCEALYGRIVAAIRKAGIGVEEHPLPPGVQGASMGGQILLKPELDSRNRLFTLLHELAHELAHHKDEHEVKSTHQRELEAESTAYVVAAVLGLEIPTSRDYLLTWKGTPEQLRASMTTVQTLVRKMLAIVQPAESRQRHAA